MTALTRILFGLCITVATCAAANAADRMIVILDASGSMWGQIDGKPKLEIARQSLKTVLQAVPGDEEIGFMAYGHRQKGSCDDIELIVPPQSGSAGAISTAADNLKFLGKTPLSAAVRQAAEALRYTEDKARVILITDGLETCNADPCQLGKELEAAGVDFTADVVGFGLTAEEGRQVACLAENTGGKYIQASDESALKDALAKTVAPQPAPEPAPAPAPAKVEYNLIPKTFLTEGGEAPKIDVYYEVFKVDSAGGKGERVDGSYNDYKISLEPGDYIVTSLSGYAKAEQKVTVSSDKVAEPVFDLDAGALILRARPAPDTEIDGSAQIIIDYPGEGVSSSNYGQVKTVVPAGETKITVKLGAGEFNETLQVAAGQIIDKDFIVGVGKAQADAFYTEGGEKVDSGDLTWKMFKAAKKLDGSREQVSYGYGPGSKFDLPAGDYFLTVDMQAASAEIPFSIAVGEFKNISVALNAGVLAIDAPGADGFRVYEAKKNIQGERKQVAYGYGEKFQTTLVAGDYVVVTNFKADKADSETPFTMKGGERTELTVQ